MAKKVPFPTFDESAHVWRIRLWNFVKTVAVLTVTTLLSELLFSLQVEKQNLIMVYILSVIIVSRITPGYVYGVIATAISAFVFDYLITEPRLGFSFSIGFPITFFIMLSVTLATSTLTTQLKTQAQLAIEREQRTELLNEMNRKLLAARDVETIVRLTNEYLIGHIRRSVVFYTADPLLPDSGIFGSWAGYGPGDDLLASPAERKIAHRAYFAKEPPFQPEGQAFYTAVLSKDQVLGLVGISCARGPLSKGNLTFVQTLTSQVALALELQLLSDKQHRILLDAEREKMRGTLLRAVSHDLRTPLTSILGASSAILEQKGQIDEETKYQLIEDIRENSQWLIRMVENLLTVTRITKDTRKVNKTLEAAEEVVAQSVSIVRKRFPDWLIHVCIPDELLLVPMDVTLISQVIINLLENAAKNSPNGSLILVDLKKQGDWAKFDISDSGSGIPEQLLEHLFETHSPHQGPGIDSVRGMGIGLSICKTIVQAHGGTIEGENLQAGGARFTFRLPLLEVETHAV